MSSREFVNLRGPSNISLESFVCEVCNKPRSQGNKRNQHVKCSKIKQAMYKDKNR